MFVKRFYEPSIAQASYLIGCQANGEAIVIDANRDVDQYIKAMPTGSTPSSTKVGRCTMAIACSSATSASTCCTRPGTRRNTCRS